MLAVGVVVLGITQVVAQGLVVQVAVARAVKMPQVRLELQTQVAVVAVLVSLIQTARQAAPALSF